MIPKFDFSSRGLGVPELISGEGVIPSKTVLFALDVQAQVDIALVTHIGRQAGAHLAPFAGRAYVSGVHKALDQTVISPTQPLVRSAPCLHRFQPLDIGRSSSQLINQSIQKLEEGHVTVVDLADAFGGGRFAAATWATVTTPASLKTALHVPA